MEAKMKEKVHLLKEEGKQYSTSNFAKSYNIGRIVISLIVIVLLVLMLM